MTPQEKLPDMIEAAKRAAKIAYCPYSHFPVGAAVLTQSGNIFSGANIENASYSVTLCAERNAAAHAIAAEQLQLAALVLYTATPVPSTPCGACRQFLSEFNPDLIVYCVCDGEQVIHSSLQVLLPAGFRLPNAQVKR